MKKIALIFLVLPLLWSCQDLNSVTPPDEYDLGSQYGELITKTFNATKASYETNYRPATGNGLRLLAGTYQNFETAFFIKFAGLPTDSATFIDSAFVELTSMSVFGSGQQPINLQAYLVDQDWDEHTINTLPEGHNFQPTTLVDQTTVAADSDTVVARLRISSDIFHDWSLNTDSNHGLYIKAEQNISNHIREFKSFETENPLQWPKLYFYVNQGDTASVLDSTRIGFDASIIEFDSSAANPNNFFNSNGQNYLLLSSGISSRLNIEFDSLATIPRNAVIQAANIEMDVDNSDLLTGSGENDLFNGVVGTATYIRSQYYDEGTLKTDSVFTTDSRYSLYLGKSDDVMTINGSLTKQLLGAYLLQDIVNGTRESNNFYLHLIDEPSTLSVIKLFGLQHPAYSDTLKPIRLTVRYFEVTNNGF